MKHVRQEGRVWVIAAEAPDGHVWEASGTHEYIAGTWHTRPSAAERDEALAECFRLGSRLCDDPACDWCEARA